MIQRNVGRRGPPRSIPNSSKPPLKYVLGSIIYATDGEWKYLRTWIASLSARFFVDAKLQEVSSTLDEIQERPKKIGFHSGLIIDIHLGKDNWKRLRIEFKGIFDAEELVWMRRDEDGREVYDARWEIQF